MTERDGRPSSIVPSTDTRAPTPASAWPVSTPAAAYASLIARQSRASARSRARGRGGGTLRGVKPLVSCLITSYNLAHLLERALESALAQDYGVENLEIIVIDDGSTDDTAAVVEPYRDRIRYVYKENGGLVSSVNRGIPRGHGPTLALLDADDEWPADKVSRQVAILDARPEVGLVYTDMEIVDAAGA